MRAVSTQPGELGDGGSTSPEGRSGPTALQRLIIDRMREHSWSYGTVARRGGLPRATVHHLATTASRVRPPRPDTLEALARGLDLPISVVRAAAAHATGLHVDEVSVDTDTAVLIASLEELTPQDRRHVAALIGSLRHRSQDRPTLPRPPELLP